MFWSAFIFPIAAIGQQFQMLLQKELRFRSLAAFEIIAVAVGSAASIAFAVAGRGVYSLVWGQLAITTCLAVLLASVGWRRWRPRLVFKLGILEGMISFGLYQMGERAVTALAYNVDYIMVGHFLGARELGIYMLAWQLMIAPLTKINMVLTRVAFPVFSRKQTEDSALRTGYAELSKMIGIISFFVMGIVAASAPVLVPVVFGPKWKAAVPIIQILALLGVFRCLSSPVSSMLLAKGRADIGFILVAIVAAVSTVSYWFAAQHGLYTMVWTEVIVYGLYFLSVLVVLKWLIGLSYVRYFRSIAMPLMIAILTAASSYALYLLLNEAMSKNVYMLIMIIGAGLVCYLTLILLFERAYVVKYFRMLLGKEVSNGVQSGKPSEHTT
jgi:O-antigen/teichoic acid export membrane protein